ncbi:MAG: LUD domain-containing protein [Halobacteriaceae archaeon]
MASSRVQQFRQSLERADVSSTVVGLDEFDAALADAIETPAVGASLPFPRLSLSDHAITVDPGPAELRAATTGVTGSPLGIASLGTVAVASRPAGDELVALLPEYHVVVLRTADIRVDLESAFDWLTDEFAAGHDSMVLATGPSATGDMGALVQGVHGPERVHAIIVETGEPR